MMNQAQQESYDALAQRTGRRFRRAHVIALADGRLWCLDMDFYATSDQELLDGIVSRVLAIGADGPLGPAAAPDAWLRFVAANSHPHRLLYAKKPPFGMGVWIPIIVVQEEA